MKLQASLDTWQEAVGTCLCFEELIWLPRVCPMYLRDLKVLGKSEN